MAPRPSVEPITTCRAKIADGCLGNAPFAFWRRSPRPVARIPRHLLATACRPPRIGCTSLGLHLSGQHSRAFPSASTGGVNVVRQHDRIDPACLQRLSNPRTLRPRGLPMYEHPERPVLGSV